MSASTERCPHCKGRLIRARDGAVAVYVSSLLLKAGSAHGRCSNCRRKIEVPAAVLDALRGAVMLRS